MHFNHQQMWSNHATGQTAHFYPQQQGTIDSRFFGPMFPPTGGGPSFPPPGPPPGPGPGPEAGPPTSPPPSFVPAQTQQVEAFAIDPGSIRRCLFRFTYVWLRNRQQFWFYPTFVGRRSVSGFRWNGFRWVYFGISLREISSFTCS
ncbi:hypothetical protein [Halalkalibacter okhensis]|uniref:Transporter n=1 Tax=Halalkalibacter okhensis TaxID=333138 RepID=A0A0B0ILV6_9BACI|nr:hypothetical protein [Halalkalibacter okhensis]KHF40651.1 hypothetical protein LQ50_07530 [Halalkalibacter okhensis]